MRINDHNTNEKVFIIAEVGNNHEGSFDVATKMICEAAKAGADAVKFQTIIPERLVSTEDEKRIAQLKRFQLSYEQYRELKKVADREGVVFMSTPFDCETVNFLNDLVPAFKVASSDNNFYPLLRTIAETGKPIVLSTGLAADSDIDATIDCIDKTWKSKGIEGKLALLHCVSRYPVPAEDANLMYIQHLNNKYDCVVGYSDHTLGIEACVTAVALGARVIEKHFTFDKNHSDFRDHQLSADPEEFSEMVRRIRTVEIMLGEGAKDMTSEEKDVAPVIRRSVAALKDLSQGHVLTYDDLTWVRPGTGVQVGQENLLIGKKLNKNVSMGILIREEDVC